MCLAGADIKSKGKNARKALVTSKYVFQFT